MPFDFTAVNVYQGEHIDSLKQHARAHMSQVDDNFVDAEGWAGLCFFLCSRLAAIHFKSI